MALLAYIDVEGGPRASVDLIHIGFAFTKGTFASVTPGWFLWPNELELTARYMLGTKEDIHTRIHLSSLDALLIHTTTDQLN